MATYGRLEKERPATHYHKDTPEALRLLLESELARPRMTRRVRLFYGHTSGEKAGQDWHEENNVSGYLGRSTGREPIVILLPTKQSTGGPSILDDCIVRMLVDGREVYRHPKYRNGEYVITSNRENARVEIDGVTVATFAQESGAVRWINFMCGSRMTK